MMLSLKIRHLLSLLVIILTFVAGVSPKEDFLFWPFIMYPMFSKVEEKGNFSEKKFFYIDKNGHQGIVGKPYSVAPFNEDTFGKIFISTSERKTKSESTQYLTELKNTWNQQGAQFEKIQFYSLTYNSSNELISQILIMESE